MKQEFINFIDALIAAAPDVAEELMTEEVKVYLEALKQTDGDKPLFTDNGKLVLQGMQKMLADGTTMATAKVIGDELFTNTAGRLVAKQNSVATPDQSVMSTSEE